MRYLACFLALALMLAALAPAADDPPKSKLPVTGEANAKFARFDELLTTFLDKYDHPGASIAVGRDGKQLYARAYGYSDREAKQPAKPESLFRISSVSKPITAVAILQLVEQGKLDLDAKIMTVLGLIAPAKGFDARWKKVTIRHLLEHRGGWDHTKSPDPMFLSPVIVREVGGPHPAPPASIIRYMLRQPFDFDPGTKFVYSNFGYCLLGRVIERLTKQTYEVHVKKAVLAPLGIKTMRLGRTLWLYRAPNEVRYYASRKVPAVFPPTLGKQVPTPYGGYCLESMDAHAGWLATASDLFRFSSAFDDPKTCKILKPETVELMFARPEDEDKKKTTWYAKGWSVQVFPEQKRAYWHDGAIEGASSMIMRRPDRIGWVVLLNSNEPCEKSPPIAVLTVPMQLASNHCFNMK